MNSGEEKQLAVIKPYISEIQAFIDENIVGTVTMTGIVIAEKFFAKNSACLVSPNDFVKGFRLALREGLITGLEPAQSRGYKRAGAVIPKAVVISSADWEMVCSKLRLPPGSKLSEVLAAIQSLIDADEAGLGFEIEMSK